MTLPIPAAVFEQHIIVLGKTGAGKSSATRLMVEDLLDKGKRVVVVTAKSDWYGIKLSASGKEPGYAIPVFGGDHADVPLNHMSGKIIGELLATGNRSAIIQMRDFMPGERTQFWIDFASTLFRLLQGKLILVIDEVHNFAPKGKILDPKAGQMLHWSNKLAAEARGIGITLIGASQRASKVHNDFLTSCETLIAMRVTTKWDRAAVKDWIEGCGDDDAGVNVLKTLAQMKRGDAWVWSPEVEFGPKQIHFPMFKTYDSFRPQMPAEVSKLKGWADVDLAEVNKKLEFVIKEAEAKDPVKLQARVRELEHALRKKAESLPPSTEEIDRKIKQSSEEISQHFNKQLTKQKGDILNLWKRGRGLANAVAELLNEAMQAFPVEKPEFIEMQLPPIPAKIHRVSYPFLDKKGRVAEPNRAMHNGETVTGPQYKVLKTLAELLSIGKNAPLKETVAAWTAYSPTSGGFANILGQMRSTGLIDYPAPGTVSLTNLGEAAIGSVPTPDQEEINRRIKSACSGPEQKVLEVLLANEGQEITKIEIAERTGYSATSGGFANILGALRTKGLLDYPRPGSVRGAAWLFER